jgi:hypothetical protein
MYKKLQFGQTFKLRLAFGVQSYGEKSILCACGTIILMFSRENGLGVKKLCGQGVEANDLQNGRDFGRKMVADGIHLTQIGHWFKKK